MIKKFFIRIHWGYLVLPLMLLLVLPAHSQSKILSSNQNSEISIIRNYKIDVDITYCLMLDTISFNYVDRSTMTTYSVRLPDSFRIFDFVIYHDSVFFCGLNRGAMYGYFDIHDVFFSNGYIYYNDLYSNINVNVTFLEKIDVTTALSGAIHMLMTGAGYISQNSGSIPDLNKPDNNFIESIGTNRDIFRRGAIVEAWILSPGNDNIRYSIDTDSNFIYTDVAFTDNYAVVTAHTTTTPGSHVFFYYTSPTLTSKGFLDSWVSSPPTSVTPRMEADITVLQTESPIYITKMQNDTFATAINNSRNGNLTISIYPDPTQQSIHRFDIPNDTVFDDFVYNKYQNAFYMKSSSYNCDFCFTQYPFATSTKLLDGSHRRWFSLDTTDKKTKVIVIGHEGISFSVAPVFYWLFDRNDLDTCFLYSNVSNQDVGGNDYARFYNQTIDKRRAQLSFIKSKSIPFILNIDCQ